MASKLTLEIVHHAWPRLHEALWSLFKIYRSIWIEACSEHYKKQTDRGVQFVSYSLHCSSSSSIVFGKCRNSSQCLIPNLSRTSNEGGGSIRWKWKKIRTATVDPFSLGRNGNSSIGYTISFYNFIFVINLGWSFCWIIRRIGRLYYGDWCPCRRGPRRWRWRQPRSQRW